MSEISIFIDESGTANSDDKFYILTLVFHQQSKPINEYVSQYEQSLNVADLPNIPFHSEPLLNGNRSYKHLSIEQRKGLLVSFARFVRRLPIKYHTFTYLRGEIRNTQDLQEKMTRDVIQFINENLDFFQSFSATKVYYDDGQNIVKHVIDTATRTMLYTPAVERRKTSMTDYRLAQVADYICTIELAAQRYEIKDDGGTYNKFFGTRGSFKKNWFKQVRRKRLA
ncbi:DUF3800 domain-containing protein [Pauljensenia sp. UMB1235]|uniref:DUF3800 domain-containing protein n=1 Tax=unclassified Pauljensenia TaxID=2908895 RepID=UPI00254C8B42|nr:MULTISPECIES: DUF3800 domain-containing protein [unclassified Pauljensenia]MDK6399655.1 DUF3800 domain-containing protein [Pauljensenia sp. UMB9872]MDK7172098.1 DUF3800 domain-containing protein [Pauljensenia sp. UMB1235]